MANETLRTLADQRGLLVGAACSPDLLDDEARYTETLAQEFNCIVAENCMKSMYLQPERGRFEFSDADKLVAFAQRHGMRLRGHTLVWHHQLLPWLREGDYSRTEALDILRAHIFGVLEHFRGSVFCWDVVNEGLDDGGGWRENSRWFELIGAEYLAQAFRWAHEADPEAQLFYNDYGMELPGTKSDACYHMLQAFLDEGVPVHGVGFQYHLGVENRLDRAACVANIQRFADLGLDVHFTEMDMGIRKPITDALRQEQAEEYANRVRIALDTEAVSALVFWGFTDRYSWVPSFTKGEYDEALPVDREYRPKPALAAIKEVLREQSSSQS